MKTIITEALIVILCTSFATAGPIPALINFDGDTPGLPPATGGIGQPSAYYGPEDAVLVQSSAYGIITKPLVVYSGSEYAGASYTFDPIYNGILRFEATVAFDSFISSYFLQTIRSTDGAVVTRVNSSYDGTIKALDGDGIVNLGTYVPNTPFRFRMDIDLDDQTWAASIDDEMNGFADDPVYPGLLFENLHLLPHNVHTVHMDLNAYTTFVGNVAYDDISVSIVTPAKDRSFLIGTWVNIDQLSGGIAAFAIFEDQDQNLLIYTLGQCTPSPCVWGIVPCIDYSDNPGSNLSTGFMAFYDFALKETWMAATRIDYPDFPLLQVTDFNFFFDSRYDYWNSDVFIRIN